MSSESSSDGSPRAELPLSSVGLPDRHRESAAEVRDRLSVKIFQQAADKLAMFSKSKLGESFRASIAAMQPLIKHLETKPELRPKSVDLIRMGQHDRLMALIRTGDTIEVICAKITEATREAIEYEASLWKAIFNDDDEDDTAEKRDETSKEDAEKNIDLESASKTATLQERVKLLEARINRMVGQGAIDNNLAVLFLSQFASGDKKVGKPAYEILISDEEKVTEDLLREQNNRFSGTLKDMAHDGNQRVYHDEKKGIYHFNRKGSEKLVSYRIYISPKISRSPSQVLQELRKSLAATGYDNVHFKTFKDLQGRNDQITIYLMDEDIEGFEQAIKHFRENCPADLLSKENLPTGIAIAPGITVGVEPVEFNQIGRDNDKSFSYNSLIAHAITLAYSFAFHDKIALDGRENDYLLEELEEGAFPYFEQILKIVGIKPETMMLENVNQGEIPGWIKQCAGM